MLKTERLILRSWEETDAEELYNIASNEKVALPCGWMPHESVANSLMLIQTVLSERETYAVCLKETGKVIGSVGLKMGDKGDYCENEFEAEAGYWLGEEYWGNGYVPEAVKELMRYGFEDLNLNKIWCNHFDGNEKSSKVKNKLGFKYIKTEKNHNAERINKIVDLHLGCITREEWDKSK